MGRERKMEREERKGKGERMGVKERDKCQWKGNEGQRERIKGGKGGRAEGYLFYYYLSKE